MPWHEPNEILRGVATEDAMHRKRKAMRGVALTGAIAAGSLALIGSARATIGDFNPLISCFDASIADIGDLKFSPGLSTVERKNTATGTFMLNGCTANEADLDEIAAESTFGGRQDGRGDGAIVVTGVAKVKFTGYPVLRA
jgi:hypothetical protein